jgi:hypothetical protein
MRSLPLIVSALAPLVVACADDASTPGFVDPTVELRGSPEAEPVTRHREVELTFHSDEGVAFYCQRDGGPWDECVSPLVYSVTGGDGERSFAVYAVDADGNLGAPRELRWYLDVTGPAITRLTGPEEGAVVEHPRVAYTFAAGEPGVQFRCRWDEGDALPCDGEATAEDLGAGEHVFSVIAYDALGNPGRLITRRFRIEGHALP